MTATATAPVPVDRANLLELLRTTVAAKAAYWDAICALERALADGREVSDRNSDQLNEAVDTLSSGIDDPGTAHSLISEDELTFVLDAVKFD